MLTYLSPLPLLPYFPVTYLLLSSLYILCSRWPPKRGRAGSGSGPKPAVYHYCRVSHGCRPAVEVLNVGEFRWEFAQWLDVVGSQVKNVEIDEHVETLDWRQLVIGLEPAMCHHTWMIIHFVAPFQPRHLRINAVKFTSSNPKTAWFEVQVTVQGQWMALGIGDKNMAIMWKHETIHITGST